VSRSAIIYTDEWLGYDKVDKLYHREFVDHGRKQYKNGNATTNTIEGFWGIMKRGIIGVYQMASRKHLQKYVDEFVWRYNTRKMRQSGRFLEFLGKTGHRLTYKELIYGC
jgi:transposase-like protein